MVFFSKVDDLLGTDYSKKFGSGRKTVDSMLSIMSQIARNTALGLLVIDEIQHLNGAKSGGDGKMLNFFVTLVNTIGVPVVLIGTTKALSILQSEFRQARRGSGQGDFIWQRLNKDNNWELLIDALWGYQWTRKEVPLTSELNDILYEESQGIIDIAVKLYAMSQIQAILSGKEDITVNIIKQVAKENLQLVGPMLQALKSGNIKEIVKYQDICNLDMDYLGFVDKSKQSLDWDMRMKVLQKQQKQKEEQMSLSKKEQAVLKLLDLNIHAKKAEKIVEKVIEDNNSEVEVSDIVIKAVQLMASDTDKPKSKKKKDKMDEKDVRFVVEEGRKNKMTAYEALKEKGYIKPISDGFFKVV